MDFADHTRAAGGRDRGQQSNDQRKGIFGFTDRWYVALALVLCLFFCLHFLLITETSIQQLKHLGETKKRELPTLEELCAFLDINVRNIENNTILQKYLVRRIRDLAQGGCMSQFFWDGGGSYQYRHWREDMVTDSEVSNITACCSCPCLIISSLCPQLILHLFCVYMDSRLLFNPTSPEGKPFTSQHFKAYHANSQQQPKSNTYIEQIKSYPPQFGLVLKGDTFDIPAGRNNLFYALLLFLHHIKVKNFGLLGYVCRCCWLRSNSY